MKFGFAPAEPKDGVPRVEVGGAWIEFHEGDPGEPERPLLNHLAALVDSAEGTRQDAEDAGIEVESFVDAANTIAVFLWGPDRVRIEYVEHKPTFSSPEMVDRPLISVRCDGWGPAPAAYPRRPVPRPGLAPVGSALGADPQRQYRVSHLDD